MFLFKKKESQKSAQAYFRKLDSNLEEIDQMIVDYLVGKIKYKKALTDKAPAPRGPEISILDLYKNKTLNQKQYERFAKMEKERSDAYQHRRTIIDRIDSKSRTLREPLNYWHEFHRNKEYEKMLKKRVDAIRSGKAE